tara:strand:+ start:136 stop:315 length:180 start_codon:yes stop_codon:yes gene_type:complete
LFDREHPFLPEREHFSVKTRIGVHGGIIPCYDGLLQAFVPAKLFSLSGEEKCLQKEPQC